jgi:cytochrome c oxidase subunit 2
MTWNNITGPASADAIVVEIYGKQFDWTARYSGDDNKLGYADYKLIGSAEDTTTKASYTNALGVVSKNSIQWRIHGINQEIKKLHEQIDAEAKGKLAFSEANLNKMLAKVEKLERIRERIITMIDLYEPDKLAYANDDFTAKTLFLIKDQEYFFVLRSQDVLHSAYFPHFRAQMNCVPGQRTTLKVKPIYTTQEMRDITGNPDFNYILMCNKICGVSHSNMNMAVVVGTKDEYNAWKVTDGSPALTDSIAAPVNIDIERMKMPEASHGDHHAEGNDGHPEGNGH